MIHLESPEITTAVKAISDLRGIFPLLVGYGLSDIITLQHLTRTHNTNKQAKDKKKSVLKVQVFSLLRRNQWFRQNVMFILKSVWICTTSRTFWC